MVSLNRMAPTFFGFILAFVGSTSAHGVWQSEPGPVTIGERASVHSEILGENRPLLVFLPDDYEITDNRYPVLYLLDGDHNFHHATGIVEFLSRSVVCPPMIVIAIPNTDRMRDFAPALATAPSDGEGQPRFHAFLEQELIPFVDETYRSNSFRVLWGHSATGAFVFFSLARQPELFNAYLAASPSLDRDLDAVMEAAGRAFERHSPSPRSFFACYGGREDERFSRGGPALVSLMEATAPTWLTWSVDWYENDNHMSTPHRSLYEGLERVFSAWRVDRRMLIEGGIDALRRQQEKVERLYGAEWRVPESVIGPVAMTILRQGRIEDAIAMLELNAQQNPGSWMARHGLGRAQMKHGDEDRALEAFAATGPLCPEGVRYEYILNDLGYELLGEEKYPRAIAVFTFITETHPDSANAYDSLGEAYMKAGQMQRAIVNYEKSLELDPANDNAKTMLKRLKEGG